MISRITLVVIAVFWLTMNALLWRAEFGSGQGGSPVPLEVVIEKILTSPDTSSLTIFHRGEKIGFCEWITGVGEEYSKVDDSNLPTAMPRLSPGYRVQVKGLATVTGLTNRLRIDADLKATPERTWQEFDAEVTVRPLAWSIHAVAAEQTVSLKARGEAFDFERTFKFSEFQNPGRLLAEFAGPFAQGLLAELDWPAGGAAPNASALGLGLKWDSRNDVIQIGHTPVRVYRLSSRLLDRHEITVIISRVGEILRIDLPYDVVVVNEESGISTKRRP